MRAVGHLLTHTPAHTHCSGKAGVTFDSKSCGESEGEKPFNELKSEVSSLEDVIQQQQYDIAYLSSQVYANQNAYDPWGADSYGYDYGNDGYDDYDSYGEGYDYYKGKPGGAQLNEQRAPPNARQQRGRGAERPRPRPARFQSQAFFPPYHPVAKMHADASAAARRAEDAAESARADHEDAVAAAYRAQAVSARSCAPLPAC